MTAISGPSYYEVLGVPRTATLGEVRRAYRQKALKHHPDKDFGAAATAFFQCIVEAYEVLSSTRKRVLYDADQRSFAAKAVHFTANEAERLRVQEDQAQHRAALKDRLIEACKAGEAWHVMKLLRGGFAGDDLSTPDSSGKTALMYAAEAGHLQVVSVLMLYRADVNVANLDGWTATIFAVSCAQSAEETDSQGHDSCVIELLKGKANPNAKTSTGMTALHVACASGRLELALNLLTHGADPNITGSDGMTPLALASDGGHAEVVSALLEAGSSVDAADVDGRTALMFASALGHQDVVAALLEANADPCAKSNDAATSLSLILEHVVGTLSSKPTHDPQVSSFIGVIRSLLAAGAGASADFDRAENPVSDEYIMELLSKCTVRPELEGLDSDRVAELGG